MLEVLLQLSLFTAKAIIIVLCILIILLAFFALLFRGKLKPKERLIIKDLNKKYDEMTDEILHETLPKKEFKKFLKRKKKEEKVKTAHEKTPKNIYVLNFNGDIKASAIVNLREEVTAILNAATPNDEVVLLLESAGGVVHGYGFAAAQLMRFHAKKIPLIIIIDKIAASGGYLMACVADKIICAPFAIVGSIGVIVQLPNFHRYLQNKNIDFEQHTAGEFKRTITLFGENTEEGREKLQHEIEDIHKLFKNLITEHRPQIDIQKVATGEHWLGEQALELNLIDEIKTSDEYLLERSKDAKLYQISYEIKKSFLSKFFATTSMIRDKFIS
jgi:serine protease SohB